MVHTHDLVVIGAGMAGMNAAIVASGAGARVAVVERSRVGGTCPIRGCIPTKALVRSAEVAAEVARAEEFGIRVAGVEVDFPAVMERVRGIIDRGARGARGYLESLPGVTVVDGDARFAAPEVVMVGEMRLSAPRVVVATGAEPSIPPIDGLDGVPYLTSDDVLELRALPARWVVIGAGPIALELGQALARLGSMVTLVDIADRMLPVCDPEIVDALRDGLARDGVTPRLGVTIRHVRATDGGGVRVVLEGDAGVDEVLEGDALLVATGRRPAHAGLGLEEIGVEVSAGGIATDGGLRTTHPAVWAAGDVVGLPYGAFTHVARRMGVSAAENALGVRPHEADPDVGPCAVFTDPEIAMVGLTEAQARERGLNVVVGSNGFSGGKSRAWGVEYGRAKVVVDADSRRIVGANIAAYHAADLIHPVVVAMNAPGPNLDLLVGSLHIHPTLGEVVHGAAAAAASAITST